MNFPEQTFHPQAVFGIDKLTYRWNESMEKAFEKRAVPAKVVTKFEHMYLAFTAYDWSRSNKHQTVTFCYLKISAAKDLWRRNNEVIATRSDQYRPHFSNGTVLSLH